MINTSKTYKSDPQKDVGFFKKLELIIAGTNPDLWQKKRGINRESPASLADDDDTKLQLHVGGIIGQKSFDLMSTKMLSSKLPHVFFSVNLFPF